MQPVRQVQRILCKGYAVVQTTLNKFSVPAAEQAEVKAFVESTHAAIVAPAA
jgi:hypothetical protein